jgi:hypothetical protein
MARKARSLLAPVAAVVTALALPAWAAPPPPPVPLLPNPEQSVQAQLAVQQVQAQARLEASQARTQAMLDANQVKLEAQLAAQEQAGLAGAPTAVPPPLPAPVVVWPSREPSATQAGEMELDTLTPQLGRYFGAAHGVLVVRAPAHGALKLEDGDVILAIGGRAPASASQARRMLASYDPGDEVRLLILREHRRMRLTAKMPAPGAKR